MIEKRLNPDIADIPKGKKLDTRALVGLKNYGYRVNPNPNSPKILIIALKILIC